MESETIKNVAYGLTGECHPEVFTTPLKNKVTVKKPGQLTEKQIEQFFTEGYVVIENFFDVEKEINPCLDAINRAVDNCANALFEAGKIKNKYEDKGYEDRLAYLEKDFPGSNIITNKIGLPPEFANVWTNERLLNAIEQLIGPDIQGHPVWVLRPKTPQNEATTVPWHQDSGYNSNASYKVLQITGWIPFVDTNETNGCMQVVKRAHSKGMVAKHTCCAGGTWYVMMDEEEMTKTFGTDIEKNVVTCPIPKGGILLFNNLTPHRSLPNLSNHVRWTVDLRWQSSNEDVGFWGLKPGVKMRDSKNAKLDINWDEFNAIDRFKVMAHHENETYLETTMTGPWMKKWELTNKNKHVQAFLKQQAAETASA